MRNFVTYRLVGTVLLMFLACAAVFLAANGSGNMEQISLDSQAPFALLLPQSADSLTFFNENECPVEIRCHPL